MFPIVNSATRQFCMECNISCMRKNKKKMTYKHTFVVSHTRNIRNIDHNNYIRNVNLIE